MTELSAIFFPSVIVWCRCRYHSNLRLPLIYPHPYRQITVETEFDNPLYETGGVSVQFTFNYSQSPSPILCIKVIPRHTTHTANISLFHCYQETREYEVSI